MLDDVVNRGKHIMIPAFCTKKTSDHPMRVKTNFPFSEIIN